MTFFIGLFLDILAESMLVEINEFGIADNRPPPDEVERELGKLYESYLQVNR
jgi:hypothetical protein